MAALRTVSGYTGMILFCFLCAIATAKSDEQVPLVAWASDGFALSPVNAPSAGHTVSVEELESHLNTALSTAPHNLLLFLQDKVCTIFITNRFILFALVCQWGIICAAQLLFVAHHYCFLSFSCSDMMSTKEVLSGNDEVIGQVLSIMKAQSVPYTAVFTALWPSRVIEEVSPAVQSVWSRSLLQSRREEPTATNPPLEFKEKGSTCILLWAEKLVVSQYRSGKWERHDLAPKTFGEGVEPNLSGSSCNETHSRDYFLRYLIFPLISTSNVSFRIIIISLSLVHYPLSTAAVYICKHNVTIFSTPQKSQGISQKANLRQIQGFNVAGKDFSYASDCASFFTPGIWMGLVTSLLMVLVLTYGLHMIMQLRTMDRFDDPKGPAISVPQTE
uniref:ATPase H+ transporting accessory protein 1a n=1 Tax=Sinocyclocheilus rhinocerous TaxID=307959 RepID=A0A673IQJ0_9TELE